MSHTVLLVDDDENLLHGLSRALHRQPYQLYTARSANEAMAILKAHPVDVIVADQLMPGMSGVDMLAWVAEHYPEVVRIVLTGQISVDAAVRAVNEGVVYHFFTKPCDEVHLAVVIRKALEHKDLLQENQRLLEISRSRLRTADECAHSLETLAHLVTEDLEKPLEKLARACRSLEEQYHGMFDPKAEKLVDNALDAAGEVQRLVAQLLQRSRTLATPTPCAEPDPAPGEAPPATASSP